jgi:methylmalonyl-CoA epimerase
MDLCRIDHVGVAVDDEQAARRVLEDQLGCPKPKEELVEEQGVRTLIYKLGDTKIELLIPTREDSPVAKHLDKRGEGLHHLALEVDDVSGAIDELETTGLELIDHEPRPGVEDSEIAFIHPGETFGTLLELVAFPKGRPDEA